MGKRVERPAEGGQFGAMTGATGSLTPDDRDEEFVPAEQREIMDPDRAREITASAHRRAAERHLGPDEPGALIGVDLIAPNDRDGGYGSSRGLAPNDPAYRIEERPETLQPRPRPRRPRRSAAPRLGGDERLDVEKDHF